MTNFTAIIFVNTEILAKNNYYYKKIVRLYLKLENPEQAGQRYIKYEQAGGERSEVLMNDIKTMKAQQK